MKIFLQKALLQASLRFLLCHVAHEDLSTLALRRDYAPSSKKRSTAHATSQAEEHGN
jgi:hypothetical protein